MSVKDDFDSDLVNEFFNIEEFAEVAVYHPIIDEPYEFKVLFDKSSENPNPQGNGYAVVQSFHVRIKAREEDIIGGVLKEDSVTVRGVDYYIIDKNSDGHGVITITLQEQQ